MLFLELNYPKTSSYDYNFVHAQLIDTLQVSVIWAIDRDKWLAWNVMQHLSAQLLRIVSIMKCIGRAAGRLLRDQRLPGLLARY